MRIIARFEDLSLAEKFSAFLDSEGIDNSIDTNFNLQSEKTEASVWVHDEDELKKAENFFQEFLQNPNDPVYNVAPKVPQPVTPEPNEQNQEINAQDHQRVERPKEKMAVTLFFLFLCVVIFIISSMQSFKVPKGTENLPTPIQLSMLYDVPQKLDILKTYLESKGDNLYVTLDDLSQEDKVEVAKILQMPMWKGYYSFLLPKKEDGNLLSAPPFYKIRQGQVWRVFTPALLHGGLLHILFNMLWLWVLGKQVERRLSIVKSVLLILILGVVSNTAQYLVSGPYFLGFSGIILGLAGFIWSRQKVAPWEGHLIPPSTFMFLAFFVLALVGYQVLAFILQLFNIASLPGMIANTAHVVGAITGIVLGRLSFFAWRPRER